MHQQKIKSNNLTAFRKRKAEREKRELSETRKKKFLRFFSLFVFLKKNLKKSKIFLFYKINEIEILIKNGRESKRT